MIAMSGPNTTSATYAAAFVPRGDPPAWISTGRPCGEGGVFSGPSTLKNLPACDIAWTFDGSATRPVARSQMTASISVASHNLRQTSTNSSMRS